MLSILAITCADAALFSGACLTVNQARPCLQASPPIVGADRDMGFGIYAIAPRRDTLHRMSISPTRLRLHLAQKVLDARQLFLIAYATAFDAAVLVTVDAVPKFSQGEGKRESRARTSLMR